MMNKTAKEMFKELGYTHKKETTAYLIYKTNTSDCPLYYDDIAFNKNTKKVRVRREGGGVSRAVYYNHKIYAAINKQLKELGWLDE